MRSPRQRATFVRLMKKYLVARDGANLADLLENTHPADTAAILERFDRAARMVFFEVVPPRVGAEVWQELDLGEQETLLSTMATDRVAPILNALPADELVDILSEIPRDRARALLPHLEDTLAIRKLLQYAPDSAGGRMTTEFLAFASDTTVADCVHQLQQVGHDVETIYYLYVVSPEGRLQGTLSLRDLLAADPGQALSDIMTTDVVTIPEGADQEQVVSVLGHYGLLAIPVVDGGGVLLGIVTVDDAFEILEDERAEDLALASGLMMSRHSTTRPARELVETGTAPFSVHLLGWYVASLVASFGLGSLPRSHAGPFLLLASVVVGFALSARARTLVWLWATTEGRQMTLARLVLFQGIQATIFGGVGAAGALLALRGGESLSLAVLFPAVALGGVALGLGPGYLLSRRGDAARLSDSVLLLLVAVVAGMVFAAVGP